MAEHDQQFDSFVQWVNKASSWLTRHPDFHEERFRAICFDSKGRLCRVGADFMRARDEGAFPVHWIWPDQVGPLVLAFTEAAKDIEVLAKITRDMTERASA